MGKTMKILYFGNPYIKEDSLAIKVAEKLSKEKNDIEFIYIKDTFELMDIDLKDTLLLDVADGVKKVVLIDVDKIKSKAISSLHDFDLGVFLYMNHEEKVKIIAIPIGYDEQKAIEEVKNIIGSYS